jgi:hypothetical protein
VAGEDVEDHGGAVDDRHTKGRLEVALLARAELVVAGHDVGVELADELLDLLDLARAEVGVRVRPVAVLDDLADRGHAGRAQELGELGEVLALGQGAERERALLGARGGLGQMRCRHLFECRPRAGR